MPPKETRRAVPSENHPGDLMPETGAAAYLSVSVRTLQAWRLRGGGPVFLKLGGAVRYRTSDLQAFVAARLRHSTSDRGAA